MVYTCKYNSPLGNIVIAGENEALTGLWFEGQKYFAETLPEDFKEGKLPVLEETKRWLDIYFKGENPGFTPPLSLKGSDFRREIWKILLSIPYGKTMTYKEISSLISRERGLKSMSAQAVGGAIAHNPVSIIIPCHRVVGSNGSLTGYAGGIEKKIELLTLEKADMKGLFVPSGPKK